MKINTLIIFFTVLLIACSDSSDPVNEDHDTSTDSTGIIEYDLDEERISAVEFNDHLSLIQQQVYDQINQLFTSDPETVRQQLKNTKFEIEIKQNDLERMETYEGGEAFKNGVSDLLSFYQTELSGSFEEILPLLEKNGEERTATETKRLNAYDEEFAMKEAELFAKIDSAQTTFAKANNIQIIDL